MASVVLEKAEPERPLAFGTGGRLGFDFWRMQIQSILLIGSFGLVPITIRDPKSELISVYFGMLSICMGLSILETIRLLWRNRSDSRLFLKSQGGINDSGEGDRFSTGIERSSPLYGGIRTEFFQPILMALMVCWIFNLEMRRPGTIHFNGLIIFGVSCWGGMCLLSIIQIVLSLIRPAKREEVILLDHGILWSNVKPGWLEKLPNLFLPWSSLGRVVAFNGSHSTERKLQIDGAPSRWYWTIRFVRIRDEDWERLLGAIGERVEVVRQ